MEEFQYIKCPKCGATFGAPKGVTIAKCPYCGYNVVVQSNDIFTITLHSPLLMVPPEVKRSEVLEFFVEEMLKQPGVDDNSIQRALKAKVYTLLVPFLIFNSDSRVTYHYERWQGDATFAGEIAVPLNPHFSYLLDIQLPPASRIPFDPQALEGSYVIPVKSDLSAILRKLPDNVVSSLINAQGLNPIDVEIAKSFFFFKLHTITRRFWTDGSKIYDIMIGVNDNLQPDVKRIEVGVMENGKPKLYKDWRERKAQAIGNDMDPEVAATYIVREKLAKAVKWRGKVTIDDYSINVEPVAVVYIPFYFLKYGAKGDFYGLVNAASREVMFGMYTERSDFRVKAFGASVASLGLAGGVMVATHTGIIPFIPAVLSSAPLLFKSIVPVHNFGSRGSFLQKIPVIQHDKVVDITTHPVVMMKAIDKYLQSIHNKVSV